MWHGIALRQSTDTINYKCKSFNDVIQNYEQMRLLVTAVTDDDDDDDKGDNTNSNTNSGNQASVPQFTSMEIR